MGLSKAEEKLILEAEKGDEELRVSAKILSKNVIDLIHQVIIKHEMAVLEVIREIYDERKTLKVERDALRQSIDEMAPNIRKVMDERDALQADAERYRWLRDTCAYEAWHKYVITPPSKMDAAIDAAREKE